MACSVVRSKQLNALAEPTAEPCWQRYAAEHGRLRLARKIAAISYHVEESRAVRSPTVASAQHRGEGVTKPVPSHARRTAGCDLGSRSELASKGTSAAVQMGPPGGSGTTQGAACFAEVGEHAVSVRNRPDDWLRFRESNLDLMTLNLRPVCLPPFPNGLAG
jgi:hypothetical protein